MHTILQEVMLECQFQKILYISKTNVECSKSIEIYAFVDKIYLTLLAYPESRSHDYHHRTEFARHSEL